MSEDQQFSTDRMRIWHDLSDIHSFLNSTHSSFVCGSGRWESQYTCLRCEDFGRFVDDYGHGPRLDAPVKLAEILHRITNSGYVFRCYQEDGFVVPTEIDIKQVSQAFQNYVLFHSIVSISLVAKEHRQCWKTIEWIALHLNQGIVNASLGGAHIQCGDRP